MTFDRLDAESGDLPAGDFGLTVYAVHVGTADHLAGYFGTAQAAKHAAPDRAVDAYGIVGGEVGCPLREREARELGRRHSLAVPSELRRERLLKLRRPGSTECRQDNNLRCSCCS